jgi:hypothetical protein
VLFAVDVVRPSRARSRRRRDRTRVASGIAALLGLVCLAGCGASTVYLNNPVVERSIAQSILIQRHVFTRVSCPSQIPQTKDRTFRCDALFDVGREPITVTEVDGKGHVRWASKGAITVLKVSHIVSAIRRSVRAQRGVASKVTCPVQALQRKGLTFACTAVVTAGNLRVKPGRYRFKVTEVDSAGHVTFVGE